MHLKAKKRFGQHFLIDENIARKIIASLDPGCSRLLEIGPGTGILTKFLIEKDLDLKVVEIDSQAVKLLQEKLPGISDHLIHADFLKLDLNGIFTKPFSIIGNFPYNISSQILFRVIGNRETIEEVVGMFQKEVAERIVSGPGSKDYGILSVLVDAWFDAEYLFTVSGQVFRPRPAVKSAVIRLRRNQAKKPDCDESQLILLVKKAFNQRRKTLRNALGDYRFPDEATYRTLLDRRAEELSSGDFIRLARIALPRGT
ncbi:MAG: ribosomal RNA small subunit methyltransferase A [Bacteroidales bacterium]|nr:ribosomal RNA small subunit methyltransferase A [Bacteroidales bacterium]